MDLARWVLGTILLLLCVVLSVSNWTIFWQRAVRRKRAPSWAPIIGGASGATGLLIVPLNLGAWWWVPLLLDYGSLPGFVHTGIWILRGRPFASISTSIDNATAQPPANKSHHTPPPPVPELFHLRAAELFLNRATPQTLIDAACSAIELDVVTDAIVQLSLATSVDADLNKVPSLFEKACTSVGVGQPGSTQEAIESLLRHEIQRVADGRSTPSQAERTIKDLYDGLDLQSWDAAFVGKAFDINSFLVNYYQRSEYQVEDHHDPTPRESRFDALTMNAAREWLQAHPEKRSRCGIATDPRAP